MDSMMFENVVNILYVHLLVLLMLFETLGLQMLSKFKNTEWLEVCMMLAIKSCIFHTENKYKLTKFSVLQSWNQTLVWFWFTKWLKNVSIDFITDFRILALNFVNFVQP